MGEASLAYPHPVPSRAHAQSCKGGNLALGKGSRRAFCPQQGCLGQCQGRGPYLLEGVWTDVCVMVCQAEQGLVRPQLNVWTAPSTGTIRLQTEPRNPLGEACLGTGQRTKPSPASCWLPNTHPLSRLLSTLPLHPAWESFFLPSCALLQCTRTKAARRPGAQGGLGTGLGLHGKQGQPSRKEAHRSVVISSPLQT